MAFVVSSGQELDVRVDSLEAKRDSGFLDFLGDHFPIRHGPLVAGLFRACVKCFS